ncbi:MAG: hypothetical protein ACX93N_05100 [Pseudohaliea sp.]
MRVPSTVRAGPHFAFAAAIAAVALVAAALLLAALVVLHRADGPGTRLDAPLDEAAVRVGQLVDRGKGSVRVALDATGNALLTLPVAGVAADSHPTLSLCFAGPPPDRILLSAETADRAGAARLGVLGSTRGGCATAYLGRAEGWSGALKAIRLGLGGEPHGVVELTSVSLNPPGVTALFANLAWAWTQVRSWALRANNVAVSAATDLVYAAPNVAVGALAILAAALALLLARLPGASRSGVLAAGLSVLCCWLLLDALWLHQQAFTAREAFDRYGPGRDGPRPVASDDAPYVRVAERVADALGDDHGSRILVASASDFAGMRTAYHLYPRNVYWRRDHELPEPRFLQQGDYLLLLAPTAHRVADGRLTYPDRSLLGPPVAPVFVGRGSALLKVR